MNFDQPFQFNQGSLQDFSDCARRFYLRYIERRAWPAIETEPALKNELYMRQGARFHRLAQQALLDLDPARLNAAAAQAALAEPELARWWRSFQDSAAGLEPFTGGADQVHKVPEIALSMPLGAHRLIAKFDLLLVLPPGRAVIVDWKTAHHRPRREWLAARLQTRVYPLVLAAAGQALNQGEPFDPGQIELVYWFTDFPNQPERFAYSRSQYEADHAFLLDLAARIDNLPPAEFYLTTDEKRCRFCVYRSLCDRGEAAGELSEFAEFDDDSQSAAGLQFDFEQIAEIQF